MLPESIPEDHGQKLLQPLKPIPDRFTRHAPPVKWLGLGDSYTSAPGAGGDIQKGDNCQRNAGSYVIQTEFGFPFLTTNAVQFRACNGYKTTNVLQQTIPQIERGVYDFMTMTLGGNDIDFPEIAKQCLLNPIGYRKAIVNCQNVISAARKTIGKPEFAQSMYSVYESLFQTMYDDRHYQVYHLLYPQFFNPYTDDCDDQKMWFGGPKLTKDLRMDLNLLAYQLNFALKSTAANYIAYKKQQGLISWQNATRLIVIDPEDYTNLFAGHRFCDWQDLKDPNVYFFAPLAPDYPASDAVNVTSKRDAEGILVDRAANGTHGTIGALPEELAKSFHLKTIGHSQYTRVLRQVMQQSRPAERNNTGSAVSETGGNTQVVGTS